MLKADVDIDNLTPDQETAISFFKALVDGYDEEALETLFADDASWTMWGELPISGEYRGKREVLDAFLKRTQTLHKPGQLGIVVHDLIGAGPKVAIEFTASNITETGHDYENHYVQVFEVEVSQIKAVRNYTDTQYVQRTCF